MIRFRSLLALLAIASALTLVAVDMSDARVGGGSSSGSRGSRTFSAPPSTRTAPTTAAPIERSMTQPARPAATTQPAAGGAFNRPGFLGGGFLGGLAAGFLGAGLLGMLFGGGLFGGLGGMASMLGLLLQVGLVVIVARLAWAWWQRRNAPAFAGPAAQLGGMTHARTDFATGGNGAGAMGGSGEMGGSGMNGGMGGMGSGMSGGMGGSGMSGGTGTAAAPPIAPADFDAFERLLNEVQTAYGQEDLNALRRHVTPEMLSYFADDLAKNASRGVRNEISDVKLLQGDLAEAWREDDVDYATVAMTFGLNDRVVERDSGRVLEGGPTEVTELWTFKRARGGDWLLSAIQQA
jgi:predicted lipid-binding transport protein (Tim44 family)